MTLSEAVVMEEVLPKIVGMPASLTPDTPLVSSGLLDSFGVFEMLLALQRLAGRNIAPHEMRVEDFETVRAMMKAVDRIVDSSNDP